MAPVEGSPLVELRKLDPMIAQLNISRQPNSLICPLQALFRRSFALTFFLSKSYEKLHYKLKYTCPF